MKRVLIAAIVLLLAGCSDPEPLTAAKAEQILTARMARAEPIYAEVPQKVYYGPKSPKDDYDGKAERTLRNLEKEGLVTVAESHTPDGMTTFQAKVTQKGFPILGTMPSARGPVYRGHICVKRFDRVRNFIRHPNDPTVGRAEVVWHYESPTNLYPLFETKINKPLKVPFVTLVSFYWKDHSWKFSSIVPKSEGG